MKVKLIIGSIIASVATLVLTASPVFAWHPKGSIQKQVQDVTNNSATVDANDTNTALSVKSGDTLIYTFTVSNKGDVDSSGNNDMAKTVLTDKLPNGVELVDNASNRTVKFDLGTIKPQASVTKSVTVKVTSTTDGAVISNEACFVGNSKINDSPQSGCDKAVVKVTVPKPEVKGVTTLVNTGPASFLPIALAVTVLGYIGALLVQTKRSNKLS